MDLKLSELDGIQATTGIKELKPNLLIIAQTAYVLKDDEIKAKEAGCNEYITNPLKKENLFKLIKKYI